MPRSGLFPDPGFSARADRRDRADKIKARCCVVRVAQHHGAAVEALSCGYRTRCPHCGGSARVSAHGENYRCGACDATGDAITYQRAVKQQGFDAACEALERAFPDPADEDTPDLFGGEI